MPNTPREANILPPSFWLKTVGLGILGRLSIKSQKYAEEYSTTHTQFISVHWIHNTDHLIKILIQGLISIGRIIYFIMPELTAEVH